VKTAKVTRAVFDASVLVRAAIEKHPTALDWIRRLDRGVDGFAPDLIWPEVANALRREVVAQALRRSDAQHALQLLLGLPLRMQPTERVAAVALEAALALKLTVYDALYVVLADVLDATLVTADRRLAQAAARAELIP
jgi:predicted nucleic acid-binding protein